MKRILSILLSMTLCFTLCLALIACNGSNNDDPNLDDEKITYTVTVTDNDGNALAGVKLMISDSSSIFESRETDANGKATLELDTEKAGLGVMITSVPTGYEKPTATSGLFHAVFGSGKEATVKVNAVTQETVTYTVKVVDQHGNAVQGVNLQICHDVCVNCDPTDANGESKKELSKSLTNQVLKVGILEAPEGYTIPEATIDEAYHATIAIGETSITVTIIKN